MPLEKGRRSSILKPSKVRNPLGELDQLRPTDNNEDDGCTTTTTEITRNRRVSFSRKKGVALFTSEEGNTIWHNIYEEHNKPDLSDSGGGSRLHISMDEDKPEIKQEPHNHNTTLPVFNTNVTDDDDTEHCVDIQAMLTGIKRQPEKEPPALVLELSQPSISDRTDILINYKIPHDDGTSLTETRIKSEEPQVKVECDADNGELFEAEMSITQDVPIVIVTNTNKKANAETKKTMFDISLLEDKTKLNEDKENIVLQECMEHIIDDQGNEDNIYVKEEIVIKNESIHIEDMCFADNKRSMIDEYYQDVPDKRVKSEFDDPNVSDSDMSFTKAVDHNVMIEQQQDCDMSISYCFTKEVRMNNKRETIGYNVKRADMSLPSVGNEDFDPFADIKTANLSIKSNRPSEFFMNDSVENVADTSVDNKRNFEFVECDNVNNSIKEDDLNTSDVLKVKLDDSFNANLKTLENTENMVFSKRMNSQASDVSKENQPVETGRKTIVFDANTDTCNMSMTNVVASKSDLKENPLPKTTNTGTNRKTVLFDEDDIDCNMSMNDIVSAMKQSLDRGTGNNKKVESEVQKNKQQENEIDKENIKYIQPSDATNSNKPITSVIPQSNENHNSDKRKTIIFDHDVSESNMSITNVVTNNDLKHNNRKTIHFDPNNSDCDMSMTNILAFKNWNPKECPSTEVKQDIVSTCDFSITGVYPLDECEEGPSDKRKTIVFDPQMPDSNVSMTCVVPFRSQMETDESNMDCDMSITKGAFVQTQQDKRKTIVFDQNTSMGDMSMTNVACVLQRNNVDSKPDEPYYDVTMKTVAYDNNAGTVTATNNRKTIIFDQGEEDADMSMTNVLQVKHIYGRESGSSEKDINTDETNGRHSGETEIKRKTILFNQDNAECNMSMTVGVPIQKLLSTDNCENINPLTRENPNRKTIVFDHGMPEFDMSMTSVIPSQNIGHSDYKTDKRKTIHFNQETPDGNMSMTNIIPTVKQCDDKRKTIHFDPEMPDCNMSMTNVLPVQSCNDKRKTIHFNQDMPDCDMSMTNMMPSVRNYDDKRKTIHFDTEMPDGNMSMTNIIPTIKQHDDKRKTIHFDSEMPDGNMSMTNIPAVKQSDCKRKTIHFDSAMPDGNMSMTGIILAVKQSDGKRKTMHFDSEMPDDIISMTGIIPAEKSHDDKNVNKRKTMHFDSEMPDANMSMTNVIPVKSYEKPIDERETAHEENIVRSEVSAQSNMNVPPTQPEEIQEKFIRDVEDMGKSKNQPTCSQFDKTVNDFENKEISTQDSLVHINKVNEFVKPNSEIENQTSSNNVRLTLNDEINCTDDKYFEQACKSFLNSSKITDRSCLSMSSIIPRIAPNNFNLTVNSVSSYVPNVDESKSVLYDNHMEDNKIMEISKRFDGYRDPCKSANNSLFATDKSNLSLPNIEDSGLEDQLITPRIEVNREINITTNSFVALPFDFGNKSTCHDKSILENKLQMACDVSLQCSKQNISLMMNTNDNKTSFDVTLPKISETSMVNMMTKINEDDFHMSVDEVNIQTDYESSTHVCKNVPESIDVKQTEITPNECVQNKVIAGIPDNNKSLRNDVQNKIDIEEECFINDVSNQIAESVKTNDMIRNMNDCIEEKIDTLETPRVVDEQVPASNIPEIVCEIKSSPVSLNCEQKDNRTSICQNITDKSNVINDTEVNCKINVVDDNMKKMSEKRKSDSENITMDSLLNYSQPKKQKIIVPEVCSWLKEVSIVNKSNSTSIQQEEIKTPSPVCSNEEKEIDSQTYTISRGQLEQFAKIKELNEDVHEGLNGSDHFIDNVNMSLVESSLDGGCGKCGKDENIGNATDANCENCKTDETEKDCKRIDGSLVEEEGARRKNSLCESLRTSTEAEDSPLKLPDKSCIIETKQVTEPLKETLKQIIEKCVYDLDTCDVTFECKEVVFTLMRRHIRLRVVFGAELTKDSDCMTPVADILLEQKTISLSNMAAFFQNIAAKMAMHELDVRSLKSMCVVGGDVTKMVTKCCQVADSAWRWASKCYPLFVKYNLRLVDEQKWTFEILDGHRLCVWDVEIRLQNRRVLHYTKPENVKIKTASGKSPISDSSFRDVINTIRPGWMFIPDLISELHEFLRGTTKLH